MITAVVYNKHTGEIKSSGTVQYKEHALMLEDPEVMDVLFDCGDGHPLTQYVHAGELQQIPDKPSEHHVFDYSTKQWVPDAVKAWNAVKNQRSQLLVNTDWVVVKAQELGVSVNTSWLNYRQALRDITKQSDPFNLVWPTEPS